MLERKFLNFNIGSVNEKKKEMYLSIPFLGKSTFVLFQPENENTNGPAYLLLYGGNRMGTLWNNSGSDNGPAYSGQVSYPAVHQGRFRFATLYISVWPPDPEREGKIRVTTSQLKSLDDENDSGGGDSATDTGGLDMFNQAS